MARLITIKLPEVDAPGALLSDGSVLNLSAAARLAWGAEAAGSRIPGSVTAIFADGAIDDVRRLIDRAEDGPEGFRDQLSEYGAITAAEETMLGAPIPEPSLIISHGLAYRDHLEEMNVPAPSEPTGFLKAPSSVTGPGSPIVLPADHADMVDFEGEFTLVIGRPCYQVSEAEAMTHVAGYTIVNDVSARDWFPPFMNATQSNLQTALAWMLNLQGKQYPTFTPMGPVVVTADEIPDPHDLRLTTTVNGEVMQDAVTSDLLFSLGRIIAHFSQWFLLRPGDLITTGSPAGVGYGRTPQVFLRPGDIVEVSVSGVGKLSNPVIASTAEDH